MRAEDIAEDFPVVRIDSDALDAARMLAEHHLPGLLVTDTSGKPYAVLPASQVLQFIVPRYVQDDLSLAGVLSESMADHAAERLGARRSAMCCPTTCSTFLPSMQTTPSSRWLRRWRGCEVR